MVSLTTSSKTSRRVSAPAMWYVEDLGFSKSLAMTSWHAFPMSPMNKMLKSLLSSLLRPSGVELGPVVAGSGCFFVLFLLGD